MRGAHICTANLALLFRGRSYYLRLVGHDDPDMRNTAMKTFFDKFRPARGKSRFVWAPATDINAGWMVCALNPYSASN